MKTMFLSLTAVSALAMAAPAAAQSVNARSDARIDQLQTQIQAGVRTGTITRTEATPLREQLRLLRQTERQYARDGLTATERRDLQSRIKNLRQQIRYADRGGANEGRYGSADRIDMNRDSFDDRDRDRDGRWDDDMAYGANNWVDSNRDGFDDRDTDRDGRWDDNVQSGAYGQGGPYEPVCAAPSGISGVIGAVLGRNECGTNVGQRAPTNLWAVPSDYQDEYRDGNGVYYRTDGRNVYRIDSRTGLITRTYVMND